MIIDTKNLTSEQVNDIILLVNANRGKVNASSRDDELIIDLGLPVVFDGVSNTLLYSDIVKDYPVGGMISEYCRLHPTEIKDVILDCSHLYREPTLDNLSVFFYEFNKKLLKKFAIIKILK